MKWRVLFDIGVYASTTKITTGFVLPSLSCIGDSLCLLRTIRRSLELPSSGSLRHRYGIYELLRCFPTERKTGAPLEHGVGSIAHHDMNALDGCPGIEKEGRIDERPWGDTVCDPWISDRETVSNCSASTIVVSTMDCFGMVLLC